MSSRLRGRARFLTFWEETMRAAHKRRIGKHSLLLLALLTVAFFASSCRNNEVEVPPLTGPSGHRLFITMEAAPDHLVIHAPGRPRETSHITLQLKNQQGIGVAGQNVKLRITNIDLFEVNIGRLNDYNVTTDAAGFARVIYTAPDALEQQSATQIYVIAILTDPAYVDEVTDRHMLDLESSAVQPGPCASNILVPTITPNPATGHLNDTVCFSATVSRGTPPVDVTGTIVATLWDFGDGSTGTGLAVCHQYTAAGSFPVSIIVEDVNHNCGSAVATATIDRGTPATCTIVVSPTPTIVDTDVNFTAVITDPDGRVRRFAWNFGDGSSTTSSRNTTSHTYDGSGTFTVVLTITDDQGNVSTCQTSVSVSSTPPTCTFTTNPDPPIGPSPFLVTFDATGSSAEAGIATFGWDFGDGTSGSGATPSHTFTATCTPAPCTDNFNVTLTVTDTDGNTTSCSAGVTVNRP